jgi:hypothetical protein
MTFSQSDIRRKIDALLARAKGTNSPAEAMAAAAKAQELLARYNIDPATVGADAVSSGPIARKSTPGFASTLAVASAHIFACAVYRRREGRGWRVQFVGREGDRITAELMLEFFIKAVRRAEREHVAAGGRGGDAFRKVMANEIVRRAEELATDSAAIERATSTLPALKNSGPKTFRVNVDTAAAARAAGQRVSFARQAMGGATLRLGRS